MSDKILINKINKTHKMKKSGFHILALAFLALLISGCLTVEKKEYTFEFTGKNSGTLTIKYINIMSSMDDEEDVSEDDFDELEEE